MYHNTDSLSYVHDGHENEDCLDEQTCMHSEGTSVASPQCAFAYAESAAQTNIVKWSSRNCYKQYLIFGLYVNCSGSIVMNKKLHDNYELGRMWKKGGMTYFRGLPHFINLKIGLLIINTFNVEHVNAGTHAKK